MEKRHNFQEVYFYCNYYYLTRLGIQLGHVQALFLHTLPLIPTVHLRGQMSESPFYWENWGSGGEKLVSNFTTTKWQSQAQTFLNGLLSLTYIPSPTGRYRTTMVHRRMWFPKVALQQKKGVQVSKSMLRIPFCEKRLHCNTHSRNVRAR